MSLKADSKEDAQRQAEAEVEKIETEGYVEIDSIDQIEVDYIYKDAPMFLVTREGKKMQTTHLQAGDEPRQPDERGW